MHSHVCLSVCSSVCLSVTIRHCVETAQHIEDFFTNKVTSKVQLQHAHAIFSKDSVFLESLFLVTEIGSKSKQESCAIAKMTARCALYK